MEHAIPKPRVSSELCYSYLRLGLGSKMGTCSQNLCILKTLIEPGSMLSKADSLGNFWVVTHFE